jgi:inner membrane protein
MDNITHTLIGVTLALGISREQTPPRNQAIMASIVASNIADFDFLAAFIYGGGNLGYLMQHRGWSHTLIASPILAVISLGIMGWIVGRKVGEPTVERSRRRVGESTITRILRGSRKGFPSSDPKTRALRREGRIRLFGLAWAAVLLHLFADSWNDYGIHPFAPFENSWYYGDFIFILEPLLWMTMLPIAYFEFEHRWSRIACGVVVALACGVTLLGSQGGFLAFLGVLFWGAAAALINLRLGDRFSRAAIAATLALLVLSMFKVASAGARWAVQGNMVDGAQNERVHQLVVSPFPANPLLWRTVTVTTGVENSYIVRLGTVSLLPWLQSPPAHFYGIERERLAPLIEPTVPSGKTVRWLGEFRSTVLDFTAYAANSCEFSTLLKFARAPFWHREGARVFAGDLRYDQEKGLGFTKVLLKDSQGIFGHCPDYDAPWLPPISGDKLQELNKPG